jgi:phosphate transport system permease protein
VSSIPVTLRKQRRPGEFLIRVFLAACAGLSVLVTTGVVIVLVTESAPFFQNVPLWDYLFGTKWSPQFSPPAFGVLPLVWGTLMVSLGALLLAVPTGVATAIFMSEYAPGWVRQVLKPVLEILAGVPSVVYGYFALTFVTPVVFRDWLGMENVPLFNAASAAVVLAIMVLPTIVSLCDDAFRSVPRTLREGAYALAATRLEVSTRVVFPAALSGTIAAVLLAFARAIGETMAVTLAAGSTPTLSPDIFNSIQTMTAYIVGVAKGDAAAGTIEYTSIYAVGLTLFVMTLSINLLAQRVFARFKEKYE